MAAVQENSYKNMGKNSKTCGSTKTIKKGQGTEKYLTTFAFFANKNDIA